jgi:hypothetical protein
MITRRRFSAIAAAIGWYALVAQLILMILRAPPTYAGVAGEVGKYFGYFTILTNLLVALVMSAIARSPGNPRRSWLDQPRVTGALATYTTIMFLVYELMLRGQWHPTGMQWFVDLLLHDVVPAACLIFLISFVPRGALRWAYPLHWLIFPVAYSLYAFTRGAITGWYPYPFVDVAVLGLLPALRNAALLLAAFYLVGMLYVAADRAIQRTFRNDSDIRA